MPAEFPCPFVALESNVTRISFGTGRLGQAVLNSLFEFTGIEFGRRRSLTRFGGLRSMSANCQAVAASNQQQRTQDKNDCAEKHQQ